MAASMTITTESFAPGSDSSFAYYREEVYDIIEAKPCNRLKRLENYFVWQKYKMRPKIKPRMLLNISECDCIRLSVHLWGR